MKSSFFKNYVVFLKKIPVVLNMKRIRHILRSWEKSIFFTVFNILNSISYIKIKKLLNFFTTIFKRIFNVYLAGEN